jgi:putative transcriptional regulator
LREHRLRLGLSQEAVAKAVGVSRQSINSIERGRYIPSLPLALKLARLFSCQIEELFGLEEAFEPWK